MRHRLIPAALAAGASLALLAGPATAATRSGVHRGPDGIPRRLGLWRTHALARKGSNRRLPCRGDERDSPINDQKPG